VLSDDPAEAMLSELDNKIGRLEHLLAEIKTVAAGNVARAVLSGLPQAIDRWLAIISGAVVVVIAASGFGLGWWMRGDAPTVYGIKAGTEQCTSHPSGRLCWQPYLVPTPSAKPAALFQS
jgi:hypothetical protein